MNNEAEKMDINTTCEEYLEVMPLVDIVDGAEGLTMWFEVPGANAQSVTIEVKDRLLQMSAQSVLKRNGRQIVFKRTFQLADGINPQKIKAKTQDGVLTLNIPKSENAKVHKVKVE